MTSSMFDLPVERRDSGSAKWNAFPDEVLPLWLADMDFVSPPAVVAALERRAAHGVYGYADVSETLVETIQEYLASRYAWSVDADWLVWMPGVVPGLNLACSAFTGPSEAVLTLTPAYPPFLSAPLNQSRRLVTVTAPESAGRWRLPLDDLEAAVTEDTRLLLLCNPHNPLGRVWDGSDLDAIADLCERRDLVLCSDEIHCDLLLDRVRHRPAAGLSSAAAERTVTFMAPSKTYNLPGLNFAFAVIPNVALRERFETAGAGLLTHPGCFSVAAAEAAYREGGAWLNELLDYLRGNRDMVEEFVGTSLPAVRMNHVEATYLAWLDFRDTGLPDALSACLQAGVALGDGARFGAPGFLRLNFACGRAMLTEALGRLQRALAIR
jgi:cysteine-S-conjugate beta-lyase